MWKLFRRKILPCFSVIYAKKSEKNPMKILDEENTAKVLFSLILCSSTLSFFPSRRVNVWANEKRRKNLIGCSYTSRVVGLKKKFSNDVDDDSAGLGCVWRVKVKFLENKIFTKFCEKFLEWRENTARRRKQQYDLVWKKEITTDERVAKTFSFSHFPIASFLAVIIISLRNIHMEGRNERWREIWLNEHGWELERLTNNTEHSSSRERSEISRNEWSRASKTRSEMAKKKRKEGKVYN